MERITPLLERVNTAKKTAIEQGLPNTTQGLRVLFEAVDTGQEEPVAGWNSRFRRKNVPDPIFSQFDTPWPRRETPVYPSVTIKQS